MTFFIIIIILLILPFYGDNLFLLDITFTGDTLFKYSRVKFVRFTKNILYILNPTISGDILVVFVVKTLSI